MSRSGQCHLDLAPDNSEKTFNLNSHNTTTSSVSNSHNFSPTILYFSSHCVRPPAPSVGPLVEVASKLEAIRNRVPGAETESEESHKMAQSPNTFHRPRRTMRIRHSSRAHRPTLRPEVVARRTCKRQREDNPKTELVNDSDRRVDEARNQTKIMDSFFYLLYFLAFCSLLIFLIYLFLLSLLFFCCLYAFQLPYK